VPDFGEHLPDILNLTIVLSIGSLYNLMQPVEVLRQGLLEKKLDVSPKHSLSLGELLQQAKRNALILQAYFVDLNLMQLCRFVSFSLIVVSWLLLLIWGLGLSSHLAAVFIAVAVMDVFFVLTTLVVVHRRERVREA